MNFRSQDRSCMNVALTNFCLFDFLAVIAAAVPGKASPSLSCSAITKSGRKIVQMGQWYYEIACRTMVVGNSL